eukprot:589810-Ditylum_brightwellii.AAC.1
MGTTIDKSHQGVPQKLQILKNTPADGRHNMGSYRWRIKNWRLIFWMGDCLGHKYSVGRERIHPRK